MSSMKDLEQALFKFVNENMILVGIIVAFAIGIPTGVYIFFDKKNEASEYTWYSMAQARELLLEAEEKNVRDDALLDTIDDYVAIKANLSATDATPWLLNQLGNAQYDAKAFDDAIETYRELIKKYPRHSAVTLARLSLGYAYKEKGMSQEALEQFKAIEEEDNPFIKSQRALNMGLCYEKLGSIELSKNAYNEAIELSQGTDAARLAQYRLENLK